MFLVDFDFDLVAHLFWVQRAIGSNPVTLSQNQSQLKT
jgi:hypothetical protein